MSDLRLTAEVVAQTDGAITIAYAVTNIGSDTVLVCNRLYNQRTPDGACVIDPNLAYVLFDPGAVPNITKRILERGEDVMVEQPVQPCATPLAVGATFDERVTLPLPLAPADPYHPIAGRDVSDAQPSRGLVFSIGWVATSDVDAALVPEVDTTAGRLPVVKASPRVQQLERVAFDLSIPVLAPAYDALVRRTCSVCGAVNIGGHPACLHCHAPLPPPSAPAGPNWRPTHRVPDGGLDGYVAPGSSVSTPLDAGLPLEVVERTGDWAHVVAWTGWEGWVDARRLVAINPGS